MNKRKEKALGSWNFQEPLAEKEGFEPSGPVKGLLDFESKSSIWTLEKIGDLVGQKRNLENALLSRLFSLRPPKNGEKPRHTMSSKDFRFWAVFASKKEFWGERGENGSR